MFVGSYVMMVNEWELVVVVEADCEGEFYLKNDDTGDEVKE